MKEYYIGSIFEDGVLLKTSIFKLNDNKLIDINDNSLWFKLGQKRINYKVVNGIICYNNIELKNVVSLSFLKMFYKDNDIKNVVEEYNKTMDLKKKLTLVKEY